MMDLIVVVGFGDGVYVVDNEILCGGGRRKDRRIGDKDHIYIVGLPGNESEIHGLRCVRP